MCVCVCVCVRLLLVSFINYKCILVVPFLSVVWQRQLRSLGNQVCITSYAEILVNLPICAIGAAGDLQSSGWKTDTPAFTKSMFHILIAVLAVVFNVRR